MNLDKISLCISIFGLLISIALTIGIFLIQQDNQNQSDKQALNSQEISNFQTIDGIIAPRYFRGGFNTQSSFVCSISILMSNINDDYLKIYYSNNHVGFQPYEVINGIVVVESEYNNIGSMTDVDIRLFSRSDVVFIRFSQLHINDGFPEESQLSIHEASLSNYFTMVCRNLH